MRGPILWFGGKGSMTRKLLPLLPRCHTYVEAFGGGASLLFAKSPSRVEVYNDVDEGLYDFFQVLSDPDLFEQLYRRVVVLPYSRQLYNEYRATWRETEDKVERTVKWFVVARQSFSGQFGESWSLVVGASCRGMAKTTSGWLSAIESLPQIHARLQRVQVESNDWRQVLETYDTPDTLFYLDPPYHHDTRRAKRYDCEITGDCHVELVERLLRLEGKVVLSGYPSAVYAPLEAAGWDVRTFDVACHAAGKTRAAGMQGEGVCDANQRRTESVWRNPQALDGKLLF